MKNCEIPFTREVTESIAKKVGSIVLPPGKTKTVQLFTSYTLLIVSLYRVVSEKKRDEKARGFYSTNTASCYRYGKLLLLLLIIFFTAYESQPRARRKEGRKECQERGVS